MIIDPRETPFQDIHKLMIGSILPRPIAFVSTLSPEGVRNLAPFSYFTGVCSNPPTLAFAPARRGYSGEVKDTLVNIRENGEFVVNIVSEEFAEKMVLCSTDYEPGVDEFEVSGLTALPSQLIHPPRLGEAHVSFECELEQIVNIGDGSAGSGFLVIGQIRLFHVSDEVYEDGRIQVDRLRPLGRIAGDGYCRVTDTFEIVRKIRPDEGEKP
ncbi:MAG: flavin reductase family protein [Candidatus Krumholzibacteria bacterium]|jgi:flavin reductase (DIM6/NTAB) family NADH-FMN oxidoreductase RutF|nr:flavin reductase family protein [Candidatus Krumholzibacteria bacterium]MDP6668976.1 flavin reductase family protein [Candidatus Krumholzibacteria bacterium]MDP6796832.1 flavin reductase family protein [Candidatus Krumholzibacteria bacterium]MDP7021360.1 flavin reductase family protein [Candidatus Krumholzibacteria bacterium]